MENIADLEQLAGEILNENRQPETEATTFQEKYDRFAEEVRQEILSRGQVQMEQLLEEGGQRFRDVLPPERVKNVSVVIVGAGGLGNWIWRVLVGMGFRKLAIFDDDVVGPENIGPQAHQVIDIGMPKVEAIRRQAMAFRGLNLRVFRRRVMCVEDIADNLGYVPDIIIGATDSMPCRSGFISEIVSGSEAASRVQLYVDLRMALGDWNCFSVTPAKLQQAVRQSGHESSKALAILREYKNLADFTAEEGVHEPCTARAITYTGANVASYTGALVHWWIMVGSSRTPEELMESFYKDSRNGTDFNWLYRYSSREFLPETRTQAEELALARGMKVSMYENMLERLLSAKWGWEGPNVTFEVPETTNIRESGINSRLAFMALGADGSEWLVVRTCWELGEGQAAPVQDEYNEPHLQAQLAINLTRGTARMAFDVCDRPLGHQMTTFGGRQFRDGCPFVVTKALPWLVCHMLPNPEHTKEEGAWDENNALLTLGSVCPKLTDRNMEDAFMWQVILVEAGGIGNQLCGAAVRFEPDGTKANVRAFNVEFRLFRAVRCADGKVRPLKGTMHVVSPAEFATEILGRLARSRENTGRTAWFSGPLLHEDLYEVEFRSVSSFGLLHPASWSLGLVPEMCTSLQDTVSPDAAAPALEPEPEPELAQPAVKKVGDLHVNDPFFFGGAVHCVVDRLTAGGMVRAIRVDNGKNILISPTILVEVRNASTE